MICRSAAITCVRCRTTGRAVLGTEQQRPAGHGQHGESVCAIGVVLQGVAAISCGVSYTCALTTGGAVKCWGANGNGQLGDGTTTSTLSPPSAAVVGLASVLSVACGAATTCVVAAGGNAHCWGRNNEGQLGTGTTTNVLAPSGVAVVSDVKQIAPWDSHTCALQTNGDVRCWVTTGICSWASGRRTRRALCCRRPGWCCRTWCRCRVGPWPCTRARR